MTSIWILLLVAAVHPASCHRRRLVHVEETKTPTNYLRSTKKTRPKIAWLNGQLSEGDAIQYPRQLKHDEDSNQETSNHDGEMKHNGAHENHHNKDTKDSNIHKHDHGNGHQNGGHVQNGHQNGENKNHQNGDKAHGHNNQHGGAAANDSSHPHSQEASDSAATEDQLAVEGDEPSSEDTMVDESPEQIDADETSFFRTIGPDMIVSVSFLGALSLVGLCACRIKRCFSRRRRQTESDGLFKSTDWDADITADEFASEDDDIYFESMGGSQRGSPVFG